MTNTPVKHEKFIDILTALSCLSVVYLHTNGVFWRHLTGFTWITANVIESVFYFAVLIFFMISGYTLIDFRERYTVKEYLQKRFNRTVIPFIFWSLVWFIFLSCFHQLPEKALKDGFFLGILNAKILQIYWFFPLLFACYLGIIVLSFIESKKQVFSWMFL